MKDVRTYRRVSNHPSLPETVLVWKLKAPHPWQIPQFWAIGMVDHPRTPLGTKSPAPHSQEWESLRIRAVFFFRLGYCLSIMTVFPICFELSETTSYWFLCTWTEPFFFSCQHPTCQFVTELISTWFWIARVGNLDISTYILRYMSYCS